MGKGPNEAGALGDLKVVKEGIGGSVNANGVEKLDPDAKRASMLGVGVRLKASGACPICSQEVNLEFKAAGRWQI
jgi:hypothetical protein